MPSALNYHVPSEMPTTPRKSSLGISRRGPLKAHIPYRGDNPEVGKKTGVAVRHVDRQSDGFEPFEQLLEQADERTPPRPKGRKKSLTAGAHQDEDDSSDDGGEESMQLESPVRHLVNARPPVSPAKSHRSSIRPVARTSDIDFDKIPSPRPSTPSQRKVRSGVLGPSSASKYMRISEPELDSDSLDPDPGQDIADTFDYYAPQEGQSPNQVSPRRKSFSRIEEEEDEEEEQELQNIGLGLASEEEEDPPPPVKKAKTGGKTNTEGKSPQKAQTQSKSKKENLSPRQGVRRSQREHYRPLEYWRGERLVYGRTHNSGPILVPQIKEIIRIPKDAPVPFGTKRKRASRARSQSKTTEVGVVLNPEEGWDDKTKAKCTVIHFSTQQEVERRIAWTAKMVEPQPATENSWLFDKIFGDDQFIAAGQLIIPPKGCKPSKTAKDNTYVFYVIEGAVNFKIHETSMVLATGAMFMVPRGNTYFIENICKRDAKLFFTQARKVEMTQEELNARAELRRRISTVRSSSAGASATKSKVPMPKGRAVSTR